MVEHLIEIFDFFSGDWEKDLYFLFICRFVIWPVLRFIYKSVFKKGGPKNAQ